MLRLFGNGHTEEYTQAPNSPIITSIALVWKFQRSGSGTGVAFESHLK
jgi:hypothetical protein